MSSIKHSPLERFFSVQAFLENRLLPRRVLRFKYSEIRFFVSNGAGLFMMFSTFDRCYLALVSIRMSITLEGIGCFIGLSVEKLTFVQFTHIPTVRHGLTAMQGLLHLLNVDIFLVSILEFLTAV